MKFLDAIRSLLRGGGEAERAVEPPTGDVVRVAEVEAVLAELRPMVVADGGDLSLVAVDDDGWVSVRFHGACGTCAAQPLTLRAGLEPVLRERLAWFVGLRA